MRSHQNERNYKLLPIKLYVFQNQKYTLLLKCLIYLYYIWKNKENDSWNIKQFEFSFILLGSSSLFTNIKSYNFKWSKMIWEKYWYWTWYLTFIWHSFWKLGNITQHVYIPLDCLDVWFAALLPQKTKLYLLRIYHKVVHWYDISINKIKGLSWHIMYMPMCMYVGTYIIIYSVMKCHENRQSPKSKISSPIYSYTEYYCDN